MKTSDEHELPALFTAEWLSQYQIPVIASAVALLGILMCCGCGGWLFSSSNPSPKEIAENNPPRMEITAPQEIKQPLPTPPAETTPEPMPEIKSLTPESAETQAATNKEEIFIQKLRSTAAENEEYDLFSWELEVAFHNNRIKAEKDFNYHYVTLDGETYDMRQMEDDSFALLFRVSDKDAAGRSITLAALLPPSQEENLSKLVIGEGARVRGILIYNRQKDVVRLVDCEVIKTPKVMPKKRTMVKPER